MLFLSIFNHQFICEIVVAEAMHIRDALADELVGLGLVEEREGIFQRHVGKFCETLYYAPVLHAEEGWVSLHRSSVLWIQQNAGACQSVVDCTSKSAN